ncbi:glutathione S-transferase II [Polychaeton citri CBS 116435]|uniref:Glutathione S-transferase II n=1 Tax=Polychaeton citri CBS 116435 TaxID=1314669 RepID=A0A9P4UN48_9PEZI|nr:glutathione S-transferase II [Polychaeton citri CBS 116435]
MAGESSIHLYTAQTPNGIKISILLEELGLPYEFTKLEFSKQQQKEPWFLEINPNGRIPALTDKFTDGKEIRVFESGSMMQYLIDRYDNDHKLSYPAGSRDAIEVANWTFFMNAGVGPMQGQANHFFRYAPEKIQYGIDRYQTEARRLYSVLDKHLSDVKTDYLVGNKCTIADIAHWGWISAAGWAGIDINAFPTLKAWEERMWARPAVKKGANVPEPYKIKELMADKERAEAYAKESSNWVMTGMKADQDKHLQHQSKV